MSRGLGKIQRKVIEILKERGDYMDIPSLIAAVFQPGNYTNAQFQSIHRAVARIQVSGLVDAHTLAIPNEPGSRGRAKFVRYKPKIHNRRVVKENA